MPFDLAAIGQQTAGQVIGTGMGLLLEGHNDKRQIRQQQKLQDMQIKGNKEMRDYEQQKQMEMWQATNYGAQREQLEKAGLNTALMYGMSGGGGVTTGGGGMGISGAQAPSGGGEIIAQQQMSLQMQMQQAQIENIKANTNKTNVETGIAKSTGMEQALATIDNLIANTDSKKADKDLTRLRISIEDINKSYLGKTLQEQLNLLTENAKTAHEQLLQAQVKTYVDTDTQFTLAQNIRNQGAEQLARIAMMQSNIKVNDARISQMAEQIAQGWATVKQGDWKTAAEIFRTEFEANFPGAGKVIGNFVDKAKRSFETIIGGGNQEGDKPGEQFKPRRVELLPK